MKLAMKLRAAIEEKISIANQHLAEAKIAGNQKEVERFVHMIEKFNDTLTLIPEEQPLSRKLLSIIGF